MDNIEDGSADDRAAAWAARMAYGQMTPDRHAELDAWLAADRRHQGAYLRARATLFAVEEAVVSDRTPSSIDAGADIVPDHPAPRCLPYRHSAGRWMFGGAALAASLALAVMAGILPLSPVAPPAVPTTQGRILTLQDGSTARLQPGARIEFAQVDGVRRVTLIRGAATFKVAKDKTHPFIVRSGDVFAQATGTVYSVTRVGDLGGIVRVTEGAVLVWAREERDQAVLLHAGGMLALNPGPRPVQAAPTPPASRPLPLVAQLSFDNAPLRTAVERFNRINSTQIVLADPSFGDTRIVGLFEANAPGTFAQAAAAIVDGKVTHTGDKIVINSK